MNGFEHSHLRRTRRQSTAGGFVIGILIIGVGTVMLLNTLGIIDARNIWSYVPLIFVAVGIAKIFDSRGCGGGVVFGGILTVGGAIWFLDNIGVLWFDKRLVPPLVIIAVGASLLMRALDRRRLVETGGIPASSDAVINLWTIFGGVKRVVDAIDFKGGDLFAMFGGVEVDLRPAIVGDRAVVDANAIFGGVDIKVPQNWIVELKGVGIFGGYEDQTIHPPAGEAAPRLVVTGYAVFGGVSVKNA